MDTNNEFLVESTDNKVFLVQKVTKELTHKEAMGELTKIRQDLLQMRQQEQQVKMSIAEKKAEADHVTLKKNIGIIETLEKELTDKITPTIDVIKKDMRTKVRTAKAKAGYSRIKDKMQKLQLSSQIIGPIAAEHGLEMNDPIVQDIRQEFDKI